MPGKIHRLKSTKIQQLYFAARVLKILMLVGFSGNRDEGLRLLHIATDDLKDAHMSKIACFLVNFYSFIVEQFFG